MVKTNVLFLGNPGTGKSTLLNCLVGKVLFDAGMSYGAGRTTFFQKYESDSAVFMDTPGLADTRLMKQATEAITKALRESGEYKLFFMVRLENGRVVADDVATIETVMSSIDLEDVPYSVIVNNVKKRQFKAIQEKGDDYRKVVTTINVGQYTTPHILWIPSLPELEEEDNALVELPDYVTSFIQHESPSVIIEPEKVKEITDEDFRVILQELRDQLRLLREDNDALRERIEQLMKKPGFLSLFDLKQVSTWAQVAMMLFFKRV